MKATEISFQDQQIKYNQLAAEKRGLILNQVINLEKSIDWRISKYFIHTYEQPRLELEEIVISSLSLRAKYNIIIILLKKYDKEIFLVHKKLETELKNIIDIRNKMAHDWLDVTVFFKGKISESSMNTLNVKSKGKTSYYDDKSISNLSNKIIRYTNILLHWKFTRLPS